MTSRPRSIHEPEPEPLSLKPAAAAKAMGISRAKVYALVAEGRLQAVHLSGRLTLIPVASIKALLAGKPAA